MPRAGLASIAAVLACAGLASAKDCGPDATFNAYRRRGLEDPFAFSRPMDNDDRDGYSQFYGSLNYECNEDTGGAIIKQNLTFVFSPVAQPHLVVIPGGRRQLQTPPPPPVPANGNNTVAPLDGFALVAAFGIEADHCLGSDGVNVTFNVSVQYPTGVWAALTNFKGDRSGWISQQIRGAHVTNKQKVGGSVMLTDMKPEFKLSELICPKGNDCTKSPGGNAQNMTAALLVATGSDLKLSIKDILGTTSNTGTDDPGTTTSFKEDVQFSMLSPLASTICADYPIYCCAGPTGDADITCCCTIDDLNPQCDASKGFSGYVADACSAGTGQNQRCGDAVQGKLASSKDAYSSDCDVFKKAIYNFTNGHRQRVSLYPSSAAPTQATLAAAADKGSLTDDSSEGTMVGSSGSKDAISADPGTKAFNLIQLFYAELCSTSIGYNRNMDNCPGCSTGSDSCIGRWIDGSDKDMNTDEAVLTIGDVKKTSCNSAWNNFLRAVGKAGAAGIIVAIILVLGAAGYLGRRYYKKRQEAGKYNVNINDDSIYKDVASSSEAETVVR